MATPSTWKRSAAVWMCAVGLSAAVGCTEEAASGSAGPGADTSEPSQSDTTSEHGTGGTSTAGGEEDARASGSSAGGSGGESTTGANSGGSETTGTPGSGADSGSKGTSDAGGGDGAASGRDVYRFIVMGDTGEGNQAQKTVAAGARKRCNRAGGCHGFLMLGDNIYDDGPESSTDDEFKTKIDKPYRDLKYGAPPPQGAADDRKRLPIYVSLGNHDLGGAGLESQLIQYYLDYAKRHDWFVYPAEFWERQIGFVHLISIHTNPLAYLGDKEKPQGELVERALQKTTANWTIVFGHHPYRSNGSHGNAGEYEGIPGDLTPLGGEYREWVNEYVCDRVDFLLTGHDHNRQWIEKMPELTGDVLGGGSDEICDTHLAVSGAGAKTRGMEDRDNDLAFGKPTLGFLFMEFRRNKVNVEYCDKNGQTEWSKTITK